MKRLRVLQVSAFFPSQGGGIEVVAHALAKMLTAHGCAVTHIAGGADHTDREAAAHSHQIISGDYWDPFHKRVGVPMPLWGLRSLLNLWRAVQQNEQVHIHDYLYMPCFFAFVFSKIQHKKILITQHIGDIYFRNKCLSFLLHILNKTLGVFVLNRCDRAVFVSERVRDYFAALPRFRRDACVIENGVDHSIYHAMPNKNDPAAALRLLFVGRFVEKKGLLLLEQCADIPHVAWTFIGEGALSPAFWKNKPAALTVYSGLRGAALVPFYQQADLLLLPSTGEGFPLVAQEALACGTPVLLSTEVAAAFPQGNACVFSVDVGALNAARQIRTKITTLRDQRAALIDARLSASQLAEQWSWDKAADQYLVLYPKKSR